MKLEDYDELPETTEYYWCHFCEDRLGVKDQDKEPSFVLELMGKIAIRRYYCPKCHKEGEVSI